MPTMSQRVDAPIPDPPAISLPRSARNPPPSESERDWTMGIRFMPEADVQAIVDDYCAPSTTLGSYTAPTEVEWLPYTVLTYDRCSALSLFARDYEGRSQRLLDSATPKAVEKEFWRGDLAQAKGWPNLYLRKSTAVDITPTTVPTLNRATGILEQALADCGFGGQGVIHGKVETAPNLTGARRDGFLLRTIRDTLFVPGVGYDGSGPIGNANAVPSAGQTWLYATGPVTYRQTVGDLFPDWPAGATVPQWAIDRNTNTITVPASRLALASWDGQCHFACRAVLPT